MRRAPWCTRNGAAGGVKEELGFCPHFLHRLRGQNRILGSSLKPSLFYMSVSNHCG